MITTNIAFFGSATYSVIIVQKLKKEGFPISCIVTQPPRKAGRKKTIIPTPVALWAKKNYIPVITPSPVKNYSLQIANKNQFCRELKTYNVDILIAAAFGQIIPNQALKTTRYGGLNIHPSLLPKYRGAAPVQWAILKGEKETGVTIIKMAKKIDTGSIIIQEKEQIESDDTTEKLYNRLFNKGAKLLTTILPDYITGKITHQAQDFSKTPYARRLTRSDGFVPYNVLKAAIKGKIVEKWSSPLFHTTRNLQPTIYILRMLRALTPWPGVWTKIKTGNQEEVIKKRLKIHEAHVYKKRLVLDCVQLEGKKKVSWKTFKLAYLDNDLVIKMS